MRMTHLGLITLAAITVAPIQAKGPTGWTNFSSKGMTLSMPKHYLTIDPKSPEMDSILKEAAVSNPKIKSLIPMIRNMGKSGGVLMYAFDTSKAGQSFVDNINMNCVDLSGTVTYDQLIAASIDMLKPYVAQGTKSVGKVISLPVGKAAVIESTVSLGTGGDTINSIGYMVLKGRKQYTVTFSAASSRAAANRSIAAQVMKTFKWK